METVGMLVQRRLEQIVIENEMLRAGFAAFPYLVLRDTRLSVGARLTYAVLLMYAWQEESCFPGQERMANDLGTSQRTLRRFLVELRERGYVSWRKQMPGGTNTYCLHDVKTKLQAKAKRPPVSPRSGQERPVKGDSGVRPIDPVSRPSPIDPVKAA